MPTIVLNYTPINNFDQNIMVNLKKIVKIQDVCIIKLPIIIICGGLNMKNNLVNN